MIKFKDIKIAVARENDISNRLLHFFASNFSLYFSFIFINLGFSPNQVTVLFFLSGFVSCLLFLSNNIEMILLGYLFWRLHIIFDLCDGDVARYTKKFSINGAYWDYMSHSILYPLVFACIMFSLHFKFSENIFLYFGVFGTILISQMLSVKNNYYRAMLFNNLTLKQTPPLKISNPMFFLLKNIFFSILSIEGFIFFYIVFVFIDLDMYFYILLIFVYLLLILALISYKFISFSKFGNCKKRA